MTPREKASELIVNYQTTVKSLDYNEAKQCTLIAVDEIITQYNFMTPNVDAKSYWIEVKKEIEKL